MKKILLLSVLFIFSCLEAFSTSKDVPFLDADPEKIISEMETNSNKVVEGHVEKNIIMSLSNCIRLALGNNPEISSAFQDILATDAQIKQTWSNFFPQIGWQTSYTHIKQLQLSDALNRNLQYDYYILGQASLQQLLYDFGVTQNEATILRLGYQANIKTFMETVNSVIRDTKDAYYKLLYCYEAEQVAQRNVDNYQQFYDQAKAFYTTGLNPKIDVTIALSNLSRSKLQLISAQNDINTAIANLNNIMGIPRLTPYKLSESLEFSPIDISFEDTVEIAKKSRPDLKRSLILLEQARQNVKLAQKAFMPTITAQGEYQRGGKHWTSNDGWNIGLALNFTGINVAQIINNINEARYLYDKQIAEAKKMQNDVFLEIQTAFIKLNEKSNQLPVAILQLKQSKENFELSFGRYRVGVASPIEYREAENTYTSAQLTYYNALYEYNSAKADLEKAIGTNLPKSASVVDLEK